MILSTVCYSGSAIPRSNTASYVATSFTSRKVQHFQYPLMVDHYSYILFTQSLSCRYTGRSTATQAYTQNASRLSSAYHASIPGCDCGIHMACPPAFGHDRSVAELFPLWFSIVSTSPLRTYPRSHKLCLDFRAMMVAGRTPVVTNSNGTTAIQHEGNATVQALSFWQVFQSFFDSNSPSVAEPTTAGMADTNAGIVRRIFGALFHVHHRVLSLATIRWST